MCSATQDVQGHMKKFGDVYGCRGAHRDIDMQNI